MKKSFALLVLFLVSLNVFAGECRLRQPVAMDNAILTVKNFNDHRVLQFQNGVVDHMPLSDEARRWQNGKLEIDVHQIFAGSDWSDLAPIGAIGTRLTDGIGLGIGFSDAYMGGMSITTQVMQQYGETVYTTTDSSGRVPTVSVVRVAGNQITSIQLTVPLKKIDGGGYSSTGESDTLCVLSVEPKAK